MGQVSCFDCEKMFEGTAMRCPTCREIYKQKQKAIKEAKKATTKRVRPPFMPKNIEMVCECGDKFIAHRWSYSNWVDHCPKCIKARKFARTIFAGST